MICLEMLFADIDTIIDCEVDCIGCLKTDCPHDKRAKERVGEGKCKTENKSQNKRNFVKS